MLSMLPIGFSCDSSQGEVCFEISGIIVVGILFFICCFLLLIAKDSVGIGIPVNMVIVCTDYKKKKPIQIKLRGYSSNPYLEICLD